MRVALYSRVSTNDQSPAMQIDGLREYATRRGWTIAGEYIDQGVSGSKDRRPELDRMMKDARRRRFDAVAVFRFDRFARSVSHLARALDEFRALGIEFVSLHESIDTSTPLGRMVYHVTAAFGEMEAEIIRERVKAGMATARRRGKHVGRPEIAVDQAVVFALLGQGHSRRAIAKRLNVSESKIRRLLRGCVGRVAGEAVRDVRNPEQFCGAV